MTEDKHTAIDRAGRGANPVWTAWVERAIVEIARQQLEFTTDDIERLRLARHGPTTPEPRALGAVMRNAANRDICIATDRWVLSERRVNHQRPLRVWRSLLLRRPS